MKKVTKVIHMADIHIRNFQRHEEYTIVFKEFLKQAKEIVAENGVNETRLLIAGDLYHTKLTTSNEQSLLLSWFLRECDKICKTIIIAGNHDFQETNSERIDSITPIIKMLNLENVKYLDMELDYKGGFYEDENIMWSVFSVFDNHTPIDVKLNKIEHPEKLYIGLFHGMTIGLKNETGFMFEHGKSLEMFNGCDVVMCGDVHLRQEQDHNGLKIVQPGSLIQQNVGETAMSKHGFILWDLETLEYEEHDIENEYGFYKFRINSITDPENSLEEFVNF